MATPAQIERQIQLETRAVEEGIAKLYANTQKAEDHRYASSTVYAQKMLKEAIPAVAAEIKRIRSARLMSGTAGPALAPLAKYTTSIPDEVAAMVALKTIFDLTMSRKDKDSVLVNVVQCVGVSIEVEAKWRWFEEQDPKLLHNVTRFHHKGKGFHYKDYDTTRRFNDENLRWDSWPRLSRVKIGVAFTDAVCRATGWWTKFLKQTTRTQRVLHLVPSESMREVISVLMQQAEHFAPLNLPMIVEPNDWSNEHKGGYLTNEVRLGKKLVRTLGPSLEQGEIPLQFLNHLQQVGYRINPFILEVATRLENEGYKVEGAKFIPEDLQPLPEKPHDIATNKEARFEYRKKAAQVYDHNSQSMKRSIRTKLTLSMARRFAKEERYFLPHSFDYRGRVYPIPSYLSLQDTCFGKSLIQFADGQPMTDRTMYWLRFQLATTYGLDKASMDERQEWALHNEALFSRVATDPIGRICDWEGCEEPFLFLAACEEFHALCVDHSRELTHLPIAVDATCSGLQVLAGCSHDGATATLVNVVPGDRPSDAYKAVAAEVNALIPSDWDLELTRGDVKRVVMTIPYNAKPISNRGYIRDALQKRGVELEKDQLTEVVRLTREAMRKVVPGPMQTMDWLNKEIAGAIKRGREHLEWTTPSGFVVRQDLRKVNTERIEAHLMGRVQLKIGTSLGDPDLKHHKNAGAPNLIHSLDATLLHLGLKDFPGPFGVIHDSVLCLAGDMDELNAAVRRAYAKCFTEHSPLHDFAEAIGAESDPPMIWDFDPASVESSAYFFS